MKRRKLVDSGSLCEDTFLPRTIDNKTEVLDSKTTSTRAAETNDIGESESLVSYDLKFTPSPSVTPVAEPIDEEMKMEAPAKNPIDHLFHKLHRKMIACQSFVTNFESFMDVIPILEVSKRKCEAEIVVPGEEKSGIEKLINKQKEDLTSLKLLGERNDALHSEVQTLERDKFLLRRRIRECEALRDLQEKNTALDLETQQNMLNDVSETKAAFETNLEDLRGELNERKAQFEAKQSQLKRMKIENEKLRKLNLEQDKQIANFKELFQVRKQDDYEKINMLTAKLEGVSADLLRCKRAYTQLKGEFKDLEQKNIASLDSAQTVEDQSKHIQFLKAQLQKLKESNEIEKFQTQLKILEAENFEIKNKLNKVEMTKDSSSNILKDRRRKAEVELSKSKEKYEVTVRALNREAQKKMEDLYNRYNFFRIQMFAIYKVLQHDESYLSAHRPAIHNAFISLKAALRKQVKVMGCNKRSLDT
jgi:myosin heavy subunit